MGADVNFVDEEGQTPLMLAAACADSEAVKLLLKAPGISINHVDNSGNSAIWITGNTVLNGMKKGKELASFVSCAELIASHATFDPVAPSHSDTQLRWACLSGAVNSVTALLKKDTVTRGAVNSLDSEGMPLLSALVREFRFLLSAQAGHRKNGEAAQYIRECALAVGCSGKCSPTTKDRKGRTALLWACHGLPRVIEHWLQHSRGEVISVLHTPDPTNEGTTPIVAALGRACRPGITRTEREQFHACASLLYSLPECDPTVECASGQTQLMWAALGGMPDVVTAWAADPRVTS